MGEPLKRRSIASWPVWVRASATGPWKRRDTSYPIGFGEARWSSNALSEAKRRVHSAGHGCGVAEVHFISPRAIRRAQSKRSPMWATISTGVRVDGATLKVAKLAGAPRIVLEAR